MTGSAQFANTSTKFNRRQLGKRPKMFKKNWDYYNVKRNYIKASGGIANYKKLKDSEKYLIRKQLREKQRIEKRRMQLLIAAIIAIFLICLLAIEYSINNEITEINIENAINIKNEKHLQHIASGDSWIESDKWDVAIMQYEKALKIKPDDYDTQYRIALAYSYKCERIKYDCDIGEKLVEELLINYPEKEIQLYKLDTIFKRNIISSIIIGN